MQGEKIRGLIVEARGSLMKMSRTPANYWGEFFVDIPVGIFLIHEGLQSPATHPLTALLTFLAGLVLFSFFEYFTHRWLFHGSLPWIVAGHRAHHDNPLGYDGIPFFLPALLLAGLLGIFVLMMPAGYACLLAGSMAFGYVTYGLSHFVIHHTNFRQRRARRWAANHHIHHYHPETNFGVTTPLWDILLRTRYPR